MKKKIIIWGHPLHTHTHSYIHDAFYRAFLHMGHETYWVNDVNDNPDIFENALVITEGQTDQDIPLVSSAQYLLHNCNTQKYVNANIEFKILQVYSHDCLVRDVEKIAECEYYQADQVTLYQPWATDLLPYQIDKMPTITGSTSRDSSCNWVGSVMGGDEHSNVRQLSAFAEAAHNSGIGFNVCRNVSPEDGVTLIQKSYLAPAIQGTWQVENGYIPCRIFKNISYGHLGLTNSKAVYDLLEGLVTYNSDCGNLFHDGVLGMSEISNAQRSATLNLIREKHTYINRANNILRVMESG